jgi:hypothetical protein
MHQATRFTRAGLIRIIPFPTCFEKFSKPENLKWRMEKSDTLQEWFQPYNLARQPKPVVIENKKRILP